MITKTLNPGFFEIEVTIKEIIYGNTKIDKIVGFDEVHNTTLKLRCNDCTVMVFKDDMNLFKNVSAGFTFKAIVKEYKPNIYNFRTLIE